MVSGVIDLFCVNVATAIAADVTPHPEVQIESPFAQPFFPLDKDLPQKAVFA